MKVLMLAVATLSFGFAQPLVSQELIYGPTIYLEEPVEGFSRPMGLMRVGDTYLYYHNREQGLIMQYTYEGKYVRTFGALGEGPGEYHDPRTVVEVREDVYIFCLGYVHKFDTQGTYYRSWYVPWVANDVVALEDDKFLVNIINTANFRMAALALHILDLEGNVYKSFDDFTMYSTMRGHGTRLLTQDTKHIYAISSMYDLTLTQYNTRFGHHTKEVIEASWYQPYRGTLEAHRPKGPQKPKPHIMGVWASQGLLYIFGRSPASSWRQAFLPAIWKSFEGGGEEVYPINPETSHLLNDFYLDVIDLESRETLYSIKYDSYEQSGLINHGFQIHWAEDDLGFWHGQFRTVQLQLIKDNK